MKVYVPYTPEGLHPSVVPAILADGGTPYMVEVGPGEEYFELYREVWARAEDAAFVEHDIEIPPGTLGRFLRCSNLWCAHSYRVYWGDVAATYGGAWALGCVRFRAEVMARYPQAVELAGQMDIHPKHPPRSYAVMDSTLTQWLKGPYRLRVCQHWPNVTHHHRYNYEGAYLG